LGLRRTLVPIGREDDHRGEQKQFSILDGHWVSLLAHVLRDFPT
jgi:hypothetical protein